MGALEWVGLNELGAVFKALPDQLDRASLSAVREAATLMKGAARAAAPVGGDRDKRPGKLQRSIGYSTPKRVGTAAWQSQVRPRARHAVRIETGEPMHNPDRLGRSYSKGTAYRYMQRAYSALRPTLGQIFIRAWSRVLRG